jgi:hypothetical protein
MQAYIPDPAYTSSEQARASFRLAGKIALGFVALIWLIQLLNWGLDLELGRFGVRPPELAGLPGILLAPLLHGSFAHLAANSLPLLVLGTGMLYLYPSSALKQTPADRQLNELAENDARAVKRGLWADPQAVPP